MKKKTGRFLAALSATVVLLLAGYTAVSNHQTTTSTTPADGLQFFNGTLEQGLSAAKTENKNVFVMVHASWCPACKKMKKTVIPQKSLGEAFNGQFINIAVDYDSEEGKLVREKYEITGTPGILFLNADGKLLSKTSGFKNKDELIKLAVAFKN
jgi:thioredoxin 1